MHEMSIALEVCRIAEQQAVGLEQPDPDRDRELPAPVHLDASPHRTAVASISTFAASSRSERTSTRVMAG